LLQIMDTTATGGGGPGNRRTPLITWGIKMCSRLKSLCKALSWRLVGALDTFCLAYFVTGHPVAAVSMVGIEVLTKSLLYYGHERAWESSLVGRALARVTS
jgi:uncharacterized membrane protein